MGLSRRQQEILEFFQTFQAGEGFGPTIREIGQALGLASAGSLLKHLRVLEKEGHLSRTPGKKRTWKLTRRLSVPTIPLLGQIAAGTPLLAEENREADLPVDPGLFGSEASFALRVKGDSMLEAQIRDGDLAVIRPQEEAENGQIVAVLIEGLEAEATLKVLRRRKDRLELWAANPEYEPLVFAGAEQARVRILGRLVGLIRARA